MMMGFGLIFMLLFFGILIVGGYWLVKMIFSNGKQKLFEDTKHEHLSPREILDKRYVRGEIGREEYEQIKADLK